VSIPCLPRSSILYPINDSYTGCARTALRTPLSTHAAELYPCELIVHFLRARWPATAATRVTTRLLLLLLLLTSRAVSVQALHWQCTHRLHCSQQHHPHHMSLRCLLSIAHQPPVECDIRSPFQRSEKDGKQRCAELAKWKEKRWVITIKAIEWTSLISWVKQLRCEVRREPLSRRFDFRDPQGNHNVMFPSNSLSHKSYLLEAPDGQKLMWRRSSAGWELLSTPSQTVVAQYINADRGHRQQSTPDQQLLGSLEIMALPTDTEPTLLDRKQRRNTNMSNSSTSSSEGGPRLGRAYQRCSVGLGIPAIICAAIASPYASAGMSKQSILGDELANLGRTEIKTFSNDVSVERKGPVLVSGATWDQSSDIRKSSDPRPRKVDLDLIVSSFVAVLAG
jgi:hypothetical protein